MLAKERKIIDNPKGKALKSMGETLYADPQARLLRRGGGTKQDTGKDDKA